MFRKQLISHRLPLAVGWLAASLLLSACSLTQRPSTPASPTPVPTRSGQLTPYLSPTATATQVFVEVVTPTTLPSPTPTPRSHTVQKGEDLFGIALRYRVSLEDLMASNPTVNPNFLSIGTVLVVPSSGTLTPSDEATAELPTPTPIPLEIGQINCVRSQEGGAWCFLPVHNSRSTPLEGLTAVFHLADEQAQNILSQTAFLPLNVIPPGASLPLATYYPPPLPANLQASAEVLTALPSPDDGRYLPTRTQNQKVLLAENGLSARISLEVALDISESTARRVWVAAVAYDSQGRVIGVRRWESGNDLTLVSGEVLPVSFNVYSVSGPIQRVELFAEARP